MRTTVKDLLCQELDRSAALFNWSTDIDLYLNAVGLNLFFFFTVVRDPNKVYSMGHSDETVV